MLLTKLCSRHALSMKNIVKISKPNCRFMAHYPIDESIFGLTEEQQSVGIIEHNKWFLLLIF